MKSVNLNDHVMGTISLRCDDLCAMLVIDKFEWENGEIDYNISMQDSHLTSEINTLKGRIKRAIKVLFGRPIYYTDIWVNEPHRMVKFKDEIVSLVEKQ